MEITISQARLRGGLHCRHRLANHRHRGRNVTITRRMVAATRHLVAAARTVVRTYGGTDSSLPQDGVSAGPDDILGYDAS